MSNQTAATMLKVYVLYVHREYTTDEIAKELGISRPSITEVIHHIGASSPRLAKNISERKRINYANASNRRFREASHV